MATSLHELLGPSPTFSAVPRGPRVVRRLSCFGCRRGVSVPKCWGDGDGICTTDSPTGQTCGKEECAESLQLPGGVVLVASKCSASAFRLEGCEPVHHKRLKAVYLSVRLSTQRLDRCKLASGTQQFLPSRLLFPLLQLHCRHLQGSGACNISIHRSKKTSARR